MAAVYSGSGYGNWMADGKSVLGVTQKETCIVKKPVQNVIPHRLSEIKKLIHVCMEFVADIFRSFIPLVVIFDGFTTNIYIQICV